MVVIVIVSHIRLSFSLFLFVILLGTVRRFLEKHGEGITAVVFCFDRVVCVPVLIDLTPYIILHLKFVRD